MVNSSQTPLQPSVKYRLFLRICSYIRHQNDHELLHINDMQNIRCPPATEQTCATYPVYTTMLPSATLYHMKVVIIIAGTNEPSNSAFLATTFAKELEQQGCVTTMFRLRELHIAHFTLERYTDGFLHEPDLLRVRDAIRAADGIVVAAPIWNFGVPADLKNLIDCLGTFFLDSDARRKGLLGGKPLYCIFTGGAPATAWHAIMRRTTSSVPTALRYFGASVIGTFFEGQCVPGRGTFGLVVDKRPRTLQRISYESRSFARVVQTFASTGAPPPKQRMTRRIMEWGEHLLERLTP